MSSSLITLDGPEVLTKPCEHEASRIQTDKSPCAPGFSPRVQRLALGLTLLLGAVLRIYLFKSGRLIFDSDQASTGIQALRALHEGKISLIMPGQDYGAEFFSHYFIPLHLLFPPSAALLRLGMIPVALGVALLTFSILRRLTGSWSWAYGAMLLVVFAPSTVTDWCMRCSSMYMHTIVTMLLSLSVFVPLLGRLRREGIELGQSSFRSVGLENVFPALLFGLIVGLGCWSHPTALMQVPAYAVVCVLFPVEGLRFVGLWGEPLPAQGSKRLVRVVGWLIQAIIVAALAKASQLLLLGWASSGTPKRGWLVLKWALGLAASGMLTQLLLARWLGPSVLRMRLAVGASALGVWLAAMPLIITTWTPHQFISNAQFGVNSFEQFFKQLASVFHTGFPVLLGWFHNLRVETTTLPVAVRAVAMAGYVLSLVVSLSYALRLRFVGRKQQSSGAAMAAGPLLHQLYTLWFFLALLAVELLAFSTSAAGSWVIEPRYLLATYWSFAVGMGCLVYLSGQNKGRLRHAGSALAGAIALFNVWSCVDMPKRPIHGWSGIETADCKLIAMLEKNDMRRVSCRFARFGYWHAYKNSYQTGERILFAPANNPSGIYIRSQDYQKAVDQAKDVVYLVESSVEKRLADYLKEQKARFEVMRCGEFRVFHRVEPNVLQDLTLEQYIQRTGGGSL